MRDLAGEPAVAAPDLPVADHRGADALAEVHVDEVARLAGELGAGRPVDVVVDGDRSGDDARQRGGRVERADQEWSVGQLDEPPGLAVDRVGGAHDREPEGAIAHLRRNVLQCARDLGGPRRAADLGLRPRGDVAYTSIASATIPSGAMLVTSAQPVVAGSA